ncbi:MAG TPA: hypothetical protein VE871_15505, partial [Longimicrobium sp.]|nr:hypothetical protein [Longimicrobium sp.]
PRQGVVLTSANDGASWTDTRISLPGMEPQLLDIWASGPGDVHAVGRAYDTNTASSAALRMRYDGTAWTSAVADSASGLYTVWGAGGTIFAAGYHGAFLAGDRKGLILSSTDGGRTFARTVVAPAVGNFREFSAAWGASPTSMYLVGTGGGILHFDGTRWEETGAAARTPLSAIWGFSVTSVYAMGGGGAVLHGVR